MQDSLKMYHILTDAKIDDMAANAIVEAIKIHHDSLKEPFEKLVTKEDLNIFRLSTKEELNILSQHISFVEKMLYYLGAIMLSGFGLVVYLIEK